VRGIAYIFKEHFSRRGSPRLVLDTSGVPTRSIIHQPRLFAPRPIDEFSRTSFPNPRESVIVVGKRKLHNRREGQG